MTGIDYPVVTINGKPLTVRFSMAAQYVMSRRGIDARQFSTLLSADNPGNVASMFDLFAAAVAENFIDPNAAPGEYKLNAPSADYWACMVPREQWTELCAAVNLAMVKVTAELRAARETPPEAQSQQLN